jgi:hypothetical protein
MEVYLDALWNSAQDRYGQLHALPAVSPIVHERDAGWIPQGRTKCCGLVKALESVTRKNLNRLPSHKFRDSPVSILTKMRAVWSYTFYPTYAFIVSKQFYFLFHRIHRSLGSPFPLCRCLTSLLERSKFLNLLHVLFNSIFVSV